MHYPLPHLTDCQQIHDETTISRRIHSRATGGTGTGIAIVDATDPQWRAIYCNETFERISGYSRAETIGGTCPLLDKIRTETQRLVPTDREIEADGDTRSVLKNYRKDGSAFWSEMTVSPVRDARGKLIQYAIALNEIGDRLEPLSLCRTLAQNLPNGAAFLFDQSLQTIFAEGPELEKLQLSPEMREGKSFLGGLPREIGDAIASNCVAAIAGQTTVAEIPYGDRIYEWQAFPIRNLSGEIWGGLSLAQNITERKQLLEALHRSQASLQEKLTQLQTVERELQQAHAQLIQSEKMSALGQLVAGVAHEINNPVNFITGNLEHARQYIDDLLDILQLYQQKYPNPKPEIVTLSEAIDIEFLVEDLPKLVSSMQIGADRIREIVLSLRNFSRVDECAVKAVDIHECIDSTLLILHNRLKGRSNHSEIQVIKNYGDLPLVECYPGQLNQVLMNLLSNAIDALDEENELRSPEQMELEPSTIEITTELYQPKSFGVNGRDAPPAIEVVVDSELDEKLHKNFLEMDAVVIRIADNGPGIAESVKKQLFTPFVTTKPVGKGTGLGLSIGHHIVEEKHGGKLLCFSELGKGTEFAIAIPLEQNAERSERSNCSR